MSAVLFGSISTIADTSELQRQAFNQAFEAHGLQWRWDREDYRATLDKNGGKNRIAEYAESRGETVDAAAIHETKSKIFQQSLATSAVTARPGVVDTIRQAKEAGLKVGLVTTTSRSNIDALVTALSPALTATDFDVIVDASSVQQPKPDQAAYSYALTSLGEDAGHCVAIEDNVGGVQAAVAAGVGCVAFPNENTAAQEFKAAQAQVDTLDFGQLQHIIDAG